MATIVTGPTKIKALMLLSEYQVNYQLFVTNLYNKTLDDTNLVARKEDHNQ